jgi:Anti-sigma factor NepR
MTKRTPQPELRPIKSTTLGSPQREGAEDKEVRQMQASGHTGPAELREGEGLDSRLQAQIGHKLKAMYDELAKEPIPDKFLELLRKLEGKETGS